jgi:hypothetical protein
MGSVPPRKGYVTTSIRMQHRTCPRAREVAIGQMQGNYRSLATSGLGIAASPALIPATSYELCALQPEGANPVERESEMQLKKLGRLVGILAGIAAFMAVAAGGASGATPAPGYEQFRGCQTAAENPKSFMCMRSVITGGHFEMGNKDVPITNPIPLTGNVDSEAENFGFNSEGGLKLVKQKVPGGVVGLTGLTWLLELLGSEALTLYAVTEPVGLPNLDINQIPQTIGLPIRVHLINSVLGNNCYVGSPSNPISLHLTTGTTNPPLPNTPITGTNPELSFDEVKQVIHAKGGVYVDNAFSAPGASGCVLTLFGFIPISINGLVNSQSGLPAAAGTNETIQNLDTEFAQVGLVYP